MILNKKNIKKLNNIQRNYLCYSFIVNKSNISNSLLNILYGIMPLIAFVDFLKMSYLIKILTSKENELKFMKKLLIIDYKKNKDLIKDYYNIKYCKLTTKIFNKFNSFILGSFILLLKKYNLNLFYKKDFKNLEKINNITTFKNFLKKQIINYYCKKDIEEIKNNKHGRLLFITNNILKQKSYRNNIKYLLYFFENKLITNELKWTINILFYTLKYNFSKYRNKDNKKRCKICNSYVDNLQIHWLYSCNIVLKQNNKICLKEKNINNFEDIENYKCEYKKEILPYWSIEEIFNISKINFKNEKLL